MKEVIIPYMVNGPDWWAGIDIFNNSESQNECRIVFMDFEGENKGVKNIILEKYSHFIIDGNLIQEHISPDVNTGRFSLRLLGTNFLYTPFQGNKDSFCIMKPFDIPKVDESIDYFKNYWNTKHEIRNYTARSGHLIGTNYSAHKPVQLLITPNDPIIVKDVKDNDLLVQDGSCCDQSIFKIYNHTRTKKINPYNYDSDTEVTGLAEYWMEPWELRQFGKGDCDDWASELASYLICAGVPNWRVRIVIGKTFGGIGHATVYVLKDDMKTWRHINSTGWAVRSGEMSLDNTVFDLERGLAIETVWFSFNNEFSWRTWNGDTSDIEARFTHIKELK